MSQMMQCRVDLLNEWERALSTRADLIASVFHPDAVGGDPGFMLDEFCERLDKLKLAAAALVQSTGSLPEGGRDG